MEAVTRALKLGINYFDTAPLYGNGKSEANLGNILVQLRPDVMVATKVSISRDNLKDIKGAVQMSLETSLSRLKRDYVDVIQLHTPLSLK
jgi:aryl-alcohol dehydrogenase-like predicted oxidoreductase